MLFLCSPKHFHLFVFPKGVTSSKLGFVVNGVNMSDSLPHTCECLDLLNTQR